MVASPSFTNASHQTRLLRCHGTRLQPTICFLSFFPFCADAISAVAPVTTSSPGNDIEDVCRRACDRHHQILLPLATAADVQMLRSITKDFGTLLVTAAQERIDTLGRVLLGQPFGAPVPQGLSIQFRFDQQAPQAVKGLLERDKRCIGRIWGNIYSFFCNKAVKDFQGKVANCACKLEGKRINAKLPGVIQ